jgi:hypothetical protein
MSPTRPQPTAAPRGARACRLQAITTRALLPPLLALLLVPAPPASAEQDGALAVELNKLEQIDSSCRVYMVFTNSTGTTLAALKLELVLFNGDGFIQRRLTLDAAPIPADKTSVKLFDLADHQCDSTGRVLVNQVLEMAGGDGPLSDGLARLRLSSKLDVDLFK